MAVRGRNLGGLSPADASRWSLGTLGCCAIRLTVSLGKVAGAQVRNLLRFQHEEAGAGVTQRVSLKTGLYGFHQQGAPDGSNSPGSR